VIDRLRSDTKRPLAADHTKMQTLFETRRPAYALADFRVDASLTSIDEQTEQILEWISIETIRT
jgi:shikimate kinase